MEGLRSVAECHRDDVEIHAEQNEVWSDVRLCSHAPEIANLIAALIKSESLPSSQIAVHVVSGSVNCPCHRSQSCRLHERSCDSNNANVGCVGYDVKLRMGKQVAGPADLPRV